MKDQFIQCTITIGLDEFEGKTLKEIKDELDQKFKIVRGNFEVDMFKIFKKYGYKPAEEGDGKVRKDEEQSKIS